MKNCQFVIKIALFFVPYFFHTWAQAQLKSNGPYQVVSGEYRFAATVDPEILEKRQTEIWARVFWPKSKIDGTIPNRLPLVAFLHGNHGTCGSGSNPRIDNGSEYTNTGKCPAGSVVTPNHEGYNYIAEQLASYGYLVISINANRGITAGSGVSGDSGLNLARGRLILKHLSLWKIWTSQGDAPMSLNSDPQSFKGKVDFSHVGLFGHSRGGEGIRAAYNLYYDVASSWPVKIPDLKFEALFEIGAVDGQTSRVLDAKNVVWNQLIPVCDGDVSNFAGIKPFNRMVQTTGQSDNGQKSIFLVYGANHNFFNTEWQESDSSGCLNHKALWNKKDWKSQAQQDIARKIVPDFFRAHLGGSKLNALNHIFNPLMAIDPEILNLTYVERDFSPNPNLDTQLRFDDFTSSQIQRDSTSDVNFKIEKGTHDLIAAFNVGWKKQAPDDDTWIKLQQLQAVDVSAMKTFDFRFSLPGSQVLTDPLNFSVSLVDELNQKTQDILLSDFVIKKFNPFYSTLYQTVRVPLGRFSGVDLTRIKTVQFKFLAPAQGNIFLAHLRFSRIAAQNTKADQSLNEMSSPVLLDMKSAGFVDEINQLMSHAADLNRIIRVKILPAKKVVDFQAAITFGSLVPFKIRNALPVLKVGEHLFHVSQIDQIGESSQITFYLSLSDLELIQKSQDVIKISYSENDLEEWIFKNTLIK